jgi:hypothetical protein
MAHLRENVIQSGLDRFKRRGPVEILGYGQAQAPGRAHGLAAEIDHRGALPPVGKGARIDFDGDRQSQAAGQGATTSTVAV